MIVVEEMVDVNDQRVTEWTQERAAGATYREIGDKFGVSHERVRQVLKEAGIPTAPRNWAARVKKEALAEEVTLWLKEHGPTPVGVVHRKFGLSSQRLTDLVTDYGVPKEYLMAGASNKTHSTSFDDIVVGVRSVWERVQDEEPGVTGLSVGLYDRSRVPGDPSPAMITSRFGWKTVCDAAGVPTAGAGRPVYTPKWSDDELVSWVGRYARDQMATGQKITFDGYDQWRHHQDGAPSGAALRTRLRRSGYTSWAEMVRAGVEL